jgi:hypothetical protein
MQANVLMHVLFVATYVAGLCCTAFATMAILGRLYKKAAILSCAALTLLVLGATLNPLG